jgi:hypothetical protein
MKKLCSILTLLVLVAVVVPVYARESHAGKPGDLGGVSIASRESHAGKPSTPSIGISGSVDNMGSGSLLGDSNSVGGGSSYGSSGYRPILSPTQMSVPRTLLNLFLYTIFVSRSRLIF